MAQLVRDGGLPAIDVGPLERARQLEGLGFLGIVLQQPLGLSDSTRWSNIMPYTFRADVEERPGVTINISSDMSTPATLRSW
jgi:hypothetical protein